MGQLRSSNTHILRIKEMYMYIKMYVHETMLGQNYTHKNKVKITNYERIRHICDKYERILQT